MPPRFLVNPARGGSDADRSTAPLAFHRSLAGYTPTALVDATGLAESLRLGRVWVKDESERLGLPAFKILGASWAVERALQQRDDITMLTAATDGNHGRAVARVAATRGLAARIFVPAGTASARIAAIESEGATVTVVDGTYEDAVRAAAALSSNTCLVVSDTSWPGYEQIPRWVIEGYSTIFAEATEQGAGPDVVVVQIGVGALAAAAVAWYGGTATRLLGVEPLSAACMLASVAAGEITEVPGPHTSVMAGLNCGLPSLIAWPAVSSAFHAFVAVQDSAALAAMRDLAAAGVVAGETGAAGLAGIRSVVETAEGGDIRDALDLTPSSRVLLLCTEGATDPELYARVVGGEVS